MARKTLRRVSKQACVKGINPHVTDDTQVRPVTVLQHSLFFRQEKDTVSKQREDDEVDGGEHATPHSSLRFDPMIHHRIPVLSSQNLEEKARLKADLTRQLKPNIVD